jgi:hypothetical protein
MRKTVLIAVLVLTIAGGVFAQSNGTQNPGDKKGPEKITLTGVLGIKDGMIALEEGGVTHYLVGLNRFIGFIDGLKAGATVTLEGFAAPRFFRVTKLTIAGQDYEIGSGPGRDMGQGRHHGNGMGFGMMYNQKNQHGNFQPKTFAPYGNRNWNDCGPQGRGNRRDDTRNQRDKRN